MIKPADTMAILVGIEEHAAEPRWNLDGPAMDACRLAHWLAKRGVPSERITLLVSPLPENADSVAQRVHQFGWRVDRAEHREVRDVFTQQVPESESGLLVVYWGGHGVMKGEDRRLLYADARDADRRNLNLSSLLRSMRSARFSAHPRQFILVDACMSLVTQLTGDGVMPDEDIFGEIRADPRRDQQVLLAASPGEVAVNLASLKTGLFSQVVLETLDLVLPEGTWPPEPARLRDVVNDRFNEFRDERRTAQVPSYIWFRARSTESEQLVFASGISEGPLRAASLGARLLSTREYHRLRTLLEGAPAPRNLPALYQFATFGIVNNIYPRSPDDLLSTVEALREPVSPLPLFRFLVQFAESSDQPTHDGLWEWVHQVAPSWRVDIKDLLALEASLRRTYLLVRLVPDLLGEGVLTTVWQYSGRDARQAIRSDEPWNREEIATALSRLLSELDHDSEFPPLIEFQAPRDMLNDSWEKLPIALADGYQEIGLTFPVVVRPLDRLEEHEAHSAWRALWNTLMARGDTYDEDLISWLDALPPGRSATPATFPIRVCAALACGETALDAVIRTGSPIALWHRQLHHNKSRRTALEEILLARGLKDLPSIVLSQRIAAQRINAAADHAGRDAVLLWDDPLRAQSDLQWGLPIAEEKA
jgi:hypothetical protein